MEHLSKSITLELMEMEIEVLPTNKTPGLSGYKCEFFQNFKEDLLPIFLWLFLEPEEIVPVSTK